MLGILTVNDHGLVEQRVISGATGLEHIMWQRLVVNGALTKAQYKKSPAHELLRKVLANAGISVDIDAQLLPVIAQFAADESQRQGRALDGADVVTQVRNKLVHPTGAHEAVYQRAGLLLEVWLLIRHYLVLLILHGLGYQGLYRDLRKIRGWASDRANVP